MPANELPVIAVMGCTASGKSSLAEELALTLDGEVISADSMQVYRGMDIGTAKVPESERRVPYHCIDICDPGEPYSAALFQRDARAAIQDIRDRGKLPIICGGTFFYVRACLSAMGFAAGDQADNPVRAYYESLLQKLGAQGLWELLRDRDPESAAVIHPNNTVRVIRAFEMFEQGESYAQRKAAFKGVPDIIPNVKLGLSVEVDALYERINKRVDDMVEQGLVDEVRGLLSRGFEDALTAQAAIGYKEIVAALAGGCSLNDAIAQIKQSTRRYSKRQRSWLRGEKGLIRIDANDADLPRITADSLDVIQKNSR